MAQCNNIEELLKRIDAYFECQLSDEEEQSLKVELLHTPFKHQAIDEALAVMGFSTSRRYLVTQAEESFGPKPKPHRRFRRVTRMAAASVAVIFCAVASLFSFQNTGQAGCIAFINGRRITSEKEVIDIMRINMNEFEDGVNEAESDIFSDLDLIVYDNEE